MGAAQIEKMFDPGMHPHFGIEVKCPYTLRSMTPRQATKYGDKFLLEIVNRKFVLTQNHENVIQIQAQVAISKAKWCDYIVYSLCRLHVQRMYFDQSGKMKFCQNFTRFILITMLPN